MKEFKVNEYLSLKLENNETIIYVKDEQFKHCKFLLLEIPVNEIKSLEDIESIDQAAEKLDKSLENPHYQEYELSPELQFWGHCSSLQVWVENNYNTRLLHSNLAFPLLKKLADVGDPLAKKVFKEEIVKRFCSGYFPTMNYLIIEEYLDYLNSDEIQLIFLENNPNLNEA